MLRARHLTIVLLIALLIVLIPIHATAQGQQVPTIGAEDPTTEDHTIDVTVGSDFSIEVWIRDLEDIGVTSFGFRMAWDPNLMEYVSHTNHVEEMTGWTISSENLDQTAGTYVLDASGVEDPVFSDESWVTFTFHCLGAGSSRVIFTNINDPEEKPSGLDAGGFGLEFEVLEGTCNQQEAAVAPPVGGVAPLFVTYMSATPDCVCDGKAGKLVVVFRVVYFSCQAYYGSYSQPVVGIKSTTFLIVSSQTHQSKEHPNIPVSPGASEGEYRAEIPIAPDDPTGRVLVYVKGNSLQVDGGLKGGPPNNISSEQTEDTSDNSLVDISPPSPAPFQPSALTELLQGNGLVIILLAIIVLLLLLLAIFARRRQRPASLTLVREPTLGPAGRRRPRATGSRQTFT